MGRLGTITKRTFLVGSAAVAGGIAFGLYKLATPQENPLEEGLLENAATFNPWILIDSEKITLITPHGDKGQGVTSMQAALLAEELDVEFGQFETSFGQPSAAYWNTAMADEGVPFMATDKSFKADAMRDVMGGVMKLMGMQGTGGSTSTPDSYEKLRIAGAMARETLKLTASKKFKTPLDQLKTKNAAVIFPGGKIVKYTELAVDAAQIAPVQDVQLRDPSEWRLVGRPMKRVDIVEKSTGTLKYGIDQTMKDMVYATVKVNPRQGGGIKRYDASTAETMRGVKKILPVTNGVAVIASNTWYAIQAAEEIEFEWEPAPYPAEQKDHWAEISKSFVEEKLDSEWRNDGDVEQALSAREVISREYRSPYVAHAPLEPLNVLIRVSAEKVEIWSGHQMPRMLQKIVAKVTGHNADQVTFHNLYMGGSFGHRLEMEHLKLAAEIANQMRGVPIKLTYSREEDFAHDFPRHIAMGRGKGTVKDGKVEAIDLEIAAPSVINSQMGRAGLSIPGPDAQIAAGAWNNPYQFPNYRMRAYRVDELAPVSSWRSVGAAGAGFIFDSFLDELIHEAGADPMAERIRLMGDKTSRTVLETVAEMCSWNTKLGATKLGENKGRGVAFVESFGVPVAEVVEVTNTEDGLKIDKVWIACDVGRIIDPVNFENLVQGGVIFGLGHAMNCEITYSDGMAEQSNYDSHDGMRMSQCPEIFVKGLENGSKVRGIGEPPVPPAAPALANAIFAATGKRLREMPFNKHIDFV
ncbi:MAG: aldehyde dehydrogenase [Methyloligella sp.]|nr:MAG: aldehyde dehydrogenase [Methyloligella sp.]